LTKGDFANEILKFLPQKCFCIEAAPVNHLDLINSIQKLNAFLGKEVYVPVLKALTSDQNEKYIECKDDKYWSDSCCYTDESKVLENKKSDSCVSTISFPALFQDYNINQVDLMKIDIEGSEFEIFLNENCFNLIKTKVNSIVAEFHLHYLRDIKGLSPEQAKKVLFDIIEKFETSGFEVILSAGRDQFGRRSNEFEILDNTCCIDFWAQRIR
jgi:FkbM family methyltransferase